MGVFDHLQKGGVFSLQPQKKPQIRKVVQSRPVPAGQSSSARTVPDSEKARARATNKIIPSKSRSTSSETASRLSANDRLRARSGNRRKRPTPEVHLASDDEGDEDDGFSSDASFGTTKRTRIDEGTEIDPKRQIRSVAAFSEGTADESPPFIHAAQVASPGESGEYKRAFEGTEESAEILLQYPSASHEERYIVNSSRTISLQQC